MKIFISHSLPRSRELADKVEWFLRMLLPSTEPWVSTGIDKGADWSHEIGQSLQEAAAGVVCLTQENLDERWILFEAGALAKQFGTKVCTLLLDVKKEEVKPPLNKFQHTTADHDEVWKLVESINKVATAVGKGRSASDLKESFDLLWPKLEATVEKLKAQGPPTATAAPQRTAEDMMAEVLTTVREVTNYVSVMFTRQEKILLLTKQEYEEVLGRAAPMLQELRLATGIGRTMTLAELRALADAQRRERTLTSMDGVTVSEATSAPQFISAGEYSKLSVGEIIELLSDRDRKKEAPAEKS